MRMATLALGLVLAACGGNGAGGDDDADAGDSTPDETTDTSGDPAADTVSDPVSDPGTDSTPPPGGYCEPLPMPTEGIVSVTTDDMGSLDSLVAGASKSLKCVENQAHTIFTLSKITSSRVSSRISSDRKSVV